MGWGTRTPFRMEAGQGIDCLVAVSSGLEWPSLRNVDVGSLAICKGGQLGAQLRQMQRCHLLVQVFWQHVDLLFIAPTVALIPQLQLCNNLQDPAKLNWLR